MNDVPTAPARLRLLVAGTGAAHAVLFLLAVWLIDRAARPVNASDAALAAYLASDASRFLRTVGLNIAPFAGIALVWFVAALRSWMEPHARADDRLYFTLQNLSAGLYVAVMFVAAAALATPLAGLTLTGLPVDADLLRLLPELAVNLMLVFGVRCAAMLALATSRLGLGLGLFPRWAAYLGYAAGLALFLSGPLSDALILVFPIWLLCLSAALVGSPSRAGARLRPRLGNHRSQ